MEWKNMGVSDQNVHRPLIGKTKEKFNEKVFFSHEQLVE
jgi:hypothetical protein